MDVFERDEIGSGSVHLGGASSSSGSLLGCGIDAEAIARFRGAGGRAIDPWDAVYTGREADHARGLADPAVGLCAGFCCKEAVLKALGTSLDYRECELFFSPERPEQELRLATSLCREHGIRGWTARVEVSDADGEAECVATVFLFGA